MTNKVEQQLSCGVEWHLRANPRALFIYNLALRMSRAGKDVFIMSQPQIAASLGWDSRTAKAALAALLGSGLLGQSANGFLYQERALPDVHVRRDIHNKTARLRRAKGSKNGSVVAITPSTKENKMSNAPHPEQDSLIDLNPQQRNCGLAKPTDFKIGGQTKERVAELADVNAANEAIPDRNEVPCQVKHDG